MHLKQSEGWKGFSFSVFLKCLPCHFHCVCLQTNHKFPELRLREKFFSAMPEAPAMKILSDLFIVVEYLVSCPLAEFIFFGLFKI